jgi:hypothetical protein
MGERYVTPLRIGEVERVDERLLAGWRGKPRSRLMRDVHGIRCYRQRSGKGILLFGNNLVL